MSKHLAAQSALFGASLLALMAAGALPAQAANTELKIGFVGVTSGPAAAWGTSNVRSMQTLAALDERDRRRQDRRQDLRHRDRHLRRPEGPQARHRRHGEDGAGRHPLCRRAECRRRRRRRAPGRREAKGIIYFPYAFPKALYTKPASNAVLGMVANYQSGPAIYKYLNGQQGREDDRLRRRQRIRSAQPARRRRRGRQGARPRGASPTGLPTRTTPRDFTPVLTADRQAEARPPGALRRRAGQRAAADPRRARTRLSRA